MTEPMCDMSLGLGMTDAERERVQQEKAAALEFRHTMSVCGRLRHRAIVGKDKYGVTVARTDIDLAGWLRHLQEELLDAAVYIERACGELEGRQ